MTDNNRYSEPDGTPFLPSNGDEGFLFWKTHCTGCTEYEPLCEILAASFYKQVPEWQWQGGKTICTARQPKETDNA